MRYFVAVIALLIGYFFNSSRDSYQFLGTWDILLILGLIIVMFFWEREIFTTKRSYDFHMRTKRKRFPTFFFLMVFIYSSFFIHDYSEFDDFNKSMLLLLAVMIVGTFIYYVVYRTLQPITVGVIGDELYQIDRWPSKRNLKNVVNLKYDRAFKILEIHFKKKRTIRLEIKEYDPFDVYQLLDIIWETSDAQIKIPRNLPKPFLQGTRL